uniref:Transmembrane protein 135-like n=2 Tax=Hirondellea gigas TaxID=1518452 RepID=A0A2P2I6Q3_9CRUS
MPSVYSKLLHYSCYEIGHTWEPSCRSSSLYIFASAFIASCQIYAVVYAVTAALQYKSLNNKKKILRLFINYLRSVLFLTTNAFGHNAAFCAFRHLLGHISYPTVSFLPGILASLAAILIERPSRRSLLAIYVTNVASECAYNIAVESGMVRPVRHGSLIMFCAALAVLGASYRSNQYQPPPLLASILRFFVGNREKGNNRVAQAPVDEPACDRHRSWSAVLSGRSPCCPHPDSCVRYSATAGAVGAVKGVLASMVLRLLVSVPALIRRPDFLPRLLPRILVSSSHLRLGAFIGWFCGSFRLVSCVCRSLRGSDSASHGAAAGAIAALGMVVYPAPSFALYSAWKTVEMLCSMGVSAGVVPAIPGATELLYCIMTAYLLHVSAVHQHYMKPSYWALLMKLTDNRIGEFNRHLLHPYGQDSGRNFQHFWPDYKRQVPHALLAKYPLGIASIPRP